MYKLSSAYADMQAGIELLQVIINPTGKHTITLSGSGSCKRRYKCLICNQLVDTDSAKWKPTKHAEVRCTNHLNEHLEFYYKNGMTYPCKCCGKRFKDVTKLIEHKKESKDCKKFGKKTITKINTMLLSKFI